MTRSTKPDPLGYVSVNPQQTAITDYFKAPGQFPGDPRMAAQPMPSWFGGDSIANGRVGVVSPNYDFRSDRDHRFGAPSAQIVPPTPAINRAMPSPVIADRQDPKAMPPFGQPNSPLHAITAAQQKTPQAPPQSAPPQPLAPAGPDPGATGMSTSPSLAGSGPRRFEPPPKTA